MRGKLFTQHILYFLNFEPCDCINYQKTNILNFKMETRGGTKERNNFLKRDGADESYLKIIDLY